MIFVTIMFYVTAPIRMLYDDVMLFRLIVCSVRMVYDMSLISAKLIISVTRSQALVSQLSIGYCMQWSVSVAMVL